MSNFLTKSENIQYVINQLWKVAEADGGVSAEEKLVIRGFALQMNADSAVYLDVGEVALEEIEIKFCLREMYRLAVAEGIKESEKKVISDFATKFNVDPKIVAATEKWAEAIAKAEADYKAAVN